MAGPTTEMLSEDYKELRAEFHATAVGLAEVRAETKTLIGVVRGGINILGSTLIASLVGGIWWAATLTANLKATEDRVNDKIKAMELRTDDRFKVVDDRFKAVETRLDKIDARLDKIDARFDRLEASIAQILEQTKPKP